MKRSSKHFINDSKYISDDIGFYEVKPFDHDLILFSEGERGYKFDFNGLRIIGGRSAKPFKSGKLGTLLKLCDDDKRFLTDFLFDSSRKYAFFISDGKILMVYNSLFRSSGLGVAAVFDYPPKILASAMKNGDLDPFGERIYSPALAEMAMSGGACALDHSDYINSALSVAGGLSAMLCEGGDTAELASSISAAAALIGCSLAFDRESIVDARAADLHSTVAILLCLLSICRRHSADRGGNLHINSEREHVGYEMVFEAVKDSFGEIDLDCVEFCRMLATRLEMPLSIELSGKSFRASFVPCRVDPSLYGLKAGINISFNCGE